MDQATAPNISCTCGSGVNHPKCCGYDLSKIPTAQESEPWQPLAQAAAENFARAQDAGISGPAKTHLMQTAERQSIEALNNVPTLYFALETLFRIRNAQGHGKVEAARVLVNRLNALFPQQYEPKLYLYHRSKNQGDLEKADFYARELINIKPLEPLAHRLRGDVLSLQARGYQAEHHFRRYLELGGAPDGGFYYQLAVCLRLQGNTKPARDFYQRSVETSSPEQEAFFLGELAYQEILTRRYDAAREIVGRMEKKHPTHPSTLRRKSALLAREGRYDEALEALVISQKMNGKEFIADDLLDRGKIYDKMGKYSEAWAAWTEAKAMFAAQALYDENVDINQARRLREFFTANNPVIKERAGLRTDAPQPIPVSGFPRSGTTVIEATIAMHPDIRAGSELLSMSDVTTSMSRLLNSSRQYPDALAALNLVENTRGLEVLRDSYLGQAGVEGAIGGGNKFFTDKALLGQMHWGLAHMMFPQSPLLQVIRNPLDGLVSLYSNNIRYLPSTNKVETAARHIVRLVELADHYRAQMPTLEEKSCDIRYEDFVRQQEAVMREIFGRVGNGLEFHHSFLAFHTSNRDATTLSAGAGTGAAQ